MNAPSVRSNTAITSRRASPRTPPFPASSPPAVTCSTYDDGRPGLAPSPQPSYVPTSKADGSRPHRHPLLTNRRLRPSTCAMVCRGRRRAADVPAGRLEPAGEPDESSPVPVPTYGARQVPATPSAPPLCRSANRATLRRPPRARSRACCPRQSRRTYRRQSQRRLLCQANGGACALSIVCLVSRPTHPTRPSQQPALPPSPLTLASMRVPRRCVTDPPSPAVDSDPRNTTVELIQARFPWVYGEITLAQNNTKHRLTPTNQPATTPAPPRRRGRSPQSAAAGPGGPRQSRRARRGTSGSRARRRSATRPRS